jgi:NADP-dependent 3-hydroxy acid dehydrogenase YdfG
VPRSPCLPARPTSATLDADEWAAALAVNVTAAARLTFTVLPGMLDREWGPIANVSSGMLAGNDTGQIWNASDPLPTGDHR